MTTDENSSFTFRAKSSDEKISFAFRVKSSKSKTTNRPPHFFNTNATAHEERALKRSRVVPARPGMVEYKEMPVKNLAKAVLAKSGWMKSFKGITKFTKEDITVVRKQEWASRYGLGFDPKIHMVSRKRRRDEFVFEQCIDSLKELDIGNDKNSPSRKEGSHVQWLRINTIVRVVSKDFEGGKWYMNKAEVLAVVGSTICDLLMENGQVIQGVKQEMLETALPNLGGFVAVLYGKHEGVYGRLMEKDIVKEMGVVRVVGSHEFINVSFDQIAEYVGNHILCKEDS